MRCRSSDDIEELAMLPATLDTPRAMSRPRPRSPSVRAVDRCARMHRRRNRHGGRRRHRRGSRTAPTVPHGARTRRDVRQDADHPRLQARSALEPVDAAHHRHPRVAHHLVGHRIGRHETASDPDEDSVVLVEQRGEGLGITRPQPFHERIVVVGPGHRRSSMAHNSSGSHRIANVAGPSAANSAASASSSWSASIDADAQRAAQPGVLGEVGVVQAGLPDVVLGGALLLADLAERALSSSTWRDRACRTSRRW